MRGCRVCCLRCARIVLFQGLSPHSLLCTVERIWTLKFSVETPTDGRGSRWLLSLELGEHSSVIGVNADLFIEGSTADPMDSRDFDGPLLAISFGPTTTELRPGRKNAITKRLDDGPMGPHLLNEYVESTCVFVP